MSELIASASGKGRQSVKAEDPAIVFDEWSARGWSATQRGDFVAALAAYRHAREIACAQLPGRVDAADLNIAMVLVQKGEAKRGEEGLREILLRTTDDQLAFLACYHLASSLRKQGRYERATRFAERAFAKARLLDTPDHLAQAHNLTGNIMLSRNELDTAMEQYQAALRIRDAQPGDTRYARSILMNNLGYCLLLKQLYDQGLATLRRALELAREVGDRRCHAECLQDLCYGLLLDGRYGEALDAGERGLREAQDAGYKDVEENCHYLLGELGTRTDDLDYRDKHFQCLQSLHPELPFLKDFLCAVDVTRIITLKR